MNDDMMRLIIKDEECFGRFATIEDAKTRAKIETELLGYRHTHFLSHYYCPYDHIDKMYWGILKALR